MSSESLSKVPGSFLEGVWSHKTAFYPEHILSKETRKFISPFPVALEHIEA